MNNKYQEDLSAIRSIMEKSTRFISLSGLSGVAAGVVALIGGIWALCLMQDSTGSFILATTTLPYTLLRQLVLIALVILATALLAAAFFTRRKTRRSGLAIWTAATKQLLISLGVPLLIGGLSCLALLYHHLYWLAVPATLVFYGLALITASKYTYKEIYYLGLIESTLGLISCFLIDYSLIAWIIGFGIIHIAYGILMHRKYH